jgi:hypothetical protein
VESRSAQDEDEAESNHATCGDFAHNMKGHDHTPISNKDEPDEGRGDISQQAVPVGCFLCPGPGFAFFFLFFFLEVP